VNKGNNLTNKRNSNGEEGVRVSFGELIGRRSYFQTTNKCESKALL
jgi:hypothetical protein